MLKINTNINNEEVAKVFICIGLAKDTVYEWAKQYRETGNIKRWIASGLWTIISNKVTFQKIQGACKVQLP